MCDTVALTAPIWHVTQNLKSNTIGRLTALKQDKLNMIIIYLI